MFTFAIARGVNRGWLPLIYAPMAQTGWKAVEQRIRPDGMVDGTSVATTAAYDMVYYYNRPARPDAMQGFGAGPARRRGGHHDAPPVRRRQDAEHVPLPPEGRAEDSRRSSVIRHRHFMSACRRRPSRCRSLAASGRGRRSRASCQPFSARSRGHRHRHESDRRAAAGRNHRARRSRISSA